MHKCQTLEQARNHKTKVGTILSFLFLFSRIFPTKDDGVPWPYNGINMHYNAIHMQNKINNLPHAGLGDPT